MRVAFRNRFSVPETHLPAGLVECGPSDRKNSSTNQRIWHPYQADGPFWFRPTKMAEGRRGIIGVMTEVTQILSQIESGDPFAAEQLLPLVYDELRKTNPT